MTNKIGVYAICKNEINSIKKWYASAKEADYVCVLDTGSTDGTWEYLQKLPIITKQIIFPEWSFALARTEAFKLLPSDTDICVHFDIDEFLSPNWATIIKSNWQGKTVKVGYIKADNVFSSKYIAHKNYENLYWDFDVFEEPIYTENNEIHYLWNYVLEDTHYIEGILLTHVKDNSKDRDYSFLAENKIEKCIIQSVNSSVSYQKLSCLLSAIEAFLYIRTKEDSPYSMGVNLPFLIDLLKNLRFDYEKDSSLYEYIKVLCIMNLSKLFSDNMESLESAYFLVDHLIPFLKRKYGFTDHIKTLTQIGLCDSCFIFIETNDFSILKKLVDFLKSLGTISTLEELLLLERLVSTIEDVKKRLNIQKPVLNTLTKNISLAESEFRERLSFTPFTV